MAAGAPQSSLFVYPVVAYIYIGTYIYLYMSAPLENALLKSGIQPQIPVPLN